ncbi:MAG: 2-amino-4-hydroxy-6-hydroxymethyldihydropteridine diphosphokinase, partial [Kiritimatiellia bacterium]|nr:2-amino-4-hydroxy-6-hydroxymethyldihydropteridine diphosphokinase [Kiritimatiellia bacterium]
AVLIFDAPFSGERWLKEAGAIEEAMGRVRTEDRFAPRSIDIDLLYCGQEHRDTDVLSLPHPRWSSRLFVVRPLADVRPNLRLPGAAGPVVDLLPALEAGAEKVAVFSSVW